MRHMEELCALVEHVVSRLEQEREARGGDSSDDGELRGELKPLLYLLWPYLAMALLTRRAA